MFKRASILCSFILLSAALGPLNREKNTKSPRSVPARLPKQLIEPGKPAFQLLDPPLKVQIFVLARR